MSIEANDSGDDDLAAWDYHLPTEQIAQQPVTPRDAARLLDLTGTSNSDREVRDLVEILEPGDLLVVNRSRVIPARLVGRKDSGGAIEVLLVHAEADDSGAWRCLVRGKVHEGTILHLAGDTRVTVTARHDDGERTVEPPPGVDLLDLARRHGALPLPPYIQRPADENDNDRYQTVFADREGSVAAPTAGLHFTNQLLAALDARGVARAQVELRVGPGTFRPVASERISGHRMHAEYAICPVDTVAAIGECRARGGRVVAVGTTVVRTLTAATGTDGVLAPFEGWTDCFLHPPQRLDLPDLLLTNFHLPRSSLLLLVACLIGREALLEAYHTAIETGYRFFSYGDAMLVPNHRRPGPRPARATSTDVGSDPGLATPSP